jgi:hypothetical protein
MQHVSRNVRPELTKHVLQGIANESNASRLWGQPNPSPYVKDAFHEYVVSGKQNVVNPSRTGTKAAVHYLLDVPPGQSEIMRLLLSVKPSDDGFRRFDHIFNDRVADSNEFYERITPKNLNEDERRVHRQALVAGMLWSEHFYFFDLDRWLTTIRTR